MPLLSNSQRFLSDLWLRFKCSSALGSQSIAHSDERLQFLDFVIGEIPDAVLIADEDGRIMRHNPKMEAIFELSELQNGSLIVNLLAHLEVFSSEKMIDLTSRLYSEERFAAKDKSGALREYRMRILPVPVNTNSHWRMMMIVDITDLVNLQKQRDRTLAILTHDMRTPIASILAVCRNETQGRPELITKVKKHAHVLLALIDDFILTIQAEADAYRMEEVLLETLLDEAIFQVRELMQARKMTLACKFGEPVFVSVDAKLMTRVVVNLIANAVRYGPEGSQIDLMVKSQGASLFTLSISNIVADKASLNGNLVQNKGFGMGLGFISAVIAKHGGSLRQSIPAQANAQAVVEITLPSIS